MQAKILIVEDDISIRQGWKFYLEQHNYKVETAYSGIEAIEILRFFTADLVVLDIELPEIDGFEFLERTKNLHENMLIIIVSGKFTEPSHKITGFQKGAIAYLSKPVESELLHETIKALLGRFQKGGKETPPSAWEVIDGVLKIHKGEALICLNGQEIELTPLENNLLKALYKARGRTLTHIQLSDAVWEGILMPQTPPTVRQLVKRLREKLEPDPENPHFILTVFGGGYKFAEAHQDA